MTPRPLRNAPQSGQPAGGGFGPPQPRAKAGAPALPVPGCARPRAQEDGFFHRLGCIQALQSSLSFCRRGRLHSGGRDASLNLRPGLRNAAGWARAVAAALLGGALWGVTAQPSVRADVDPHVAGDTFAAEVAALLPQEEVFFAPAGTPPNLRSTRGEWSSIIPWTPHIPVSAANLPDGRILTFASNQRTTFPAGPEFTFAATWNPATGEFREFNHPSHDMFCGALVMLPDGRVLVNGGRNTTVRASLFDWRVNTWTRTPDMNDPRWYNTSVALPSGRVWTVSGSGGSGTAERWDSAVGWSRLTGIDWNTVTAEPGYINIWHPFLSLAPDGRLIHFGPTDTMHWVSPEGSGTLSAAGTTVPGTHYPKEGSWVMYDEGRILVAGGGANTTANVNDTTTGTSTNLVYTVDVRGSSPVVTSRTPMAFSRQFANAAILPNGEVMVMGGNTSGLKFNDTGSILTPEVWNPASGLWRPVADASVPRNYHSLALLLPDGRILSGGGGLGGADHQDVQLFTPPNLFNADGTPATRPSIAGAPAAIGVGTRFTVTATPGMQKFSFIKMSAITHSVNTDVRFLSLPFTEVTPGTYELTAHASLNVMTPGYWMLFALDAAGVHSVSRTILVDAINAVDVVPPGNQSSYLGQAVSLALFASGPAGSVLSWSATGLPPGLAIGGSDGRISGIPTALGTFNARITVTDGRTSDIADVSWSVQPATLARTFANFANTSGLSLNGRAAVIAGALRLASNAANQAGSAYITNAVPIGPNTSFSTRFVYRIHGTADGADGLTFCVQANGPNALGVGGSGLGYGGLSQSLAVEIDNYAGTGDANANHVAVLSNGDVATHLATYTPAWDLENAASQTAWVEYDGPANQLRVFLAASNVVQRPAVPVITLSVDLPALVGGQAWFGFTGATGGQFNNHDIESWTLSVNALALPAPPSFASPGPQTNVIGVAAQRQLSATDPNGDLLTWSATGLPPGLSLNPSSGLISGVPNQAGTFSPTIVVTDGNTPAVSATFSWVVDDVLTVQALSGAAVPVGTPVTLTARAVGGLNPQFAWSFGDGTPDTAFADLPGITHAYATPGRYLITVTVRDQTGRTVTASYRQAVHAPLTASRPTQSSSVVYEDRTGANDRLWVVNPDNDSVTVFDAVTRARLAEVKVGRAPRTLTMGVDGRVWVANTESSTLTVLRGDLSVAQTVALPRGSRPHGVVFDPAGTSLYVALEHGGQVLKLNPVGGAVIGATTVGPHVRHVSVTADGTRVLATRFVTPRLPGEDTAIVDTTVAGVKHGGEVLMIDATAMTLLATGILEHSEVADTSNSAQGIPNYLGAAAISPDGLSAWVPSKQDNIKRGRLRNGGELTHDMAMRSIASRLILATQTEDLGRRVDFDNAGMASASAFDPQGNFLFTALEGSREVAVADAWAGQEILRFDAGRAPQGLVLAPDGRTLFVHNFMDRTVTIHDVSALAAGAGTPPPPPVTLNCVATEQLSPDVLLGKQLFYDTRDTRVAFQQYISCASCHNDGGQDGRVWDFTQFGEGLRNTITLRGHGGTAHGPLHWTGNFDEVQDFEGQIRDFARGTGLMNDADFHAGTRATALGDRKAGLSRDLDALAAYVSSLTAHGFSPERNPDGTLTAAALAGRSLFQQLNCAQCHAGTRFTDSALGVFRDVGTIKPSSGGRLGGPLTGLDTPTLLGVYATGPYLHDGSAATVEDAIVAHRGVALTSVDLANLGAYLRQLDDSDAVRTPPVLGWSRPAAVTYGTPLSGLQLNATASAPGSFVYTPGAGAVLNAGTGRVLTVVFTPTDLATFLAVTGSVTIDVLRAPLTVRAQNKAKLYGAALPALTATYVGLVNGDTAAVLDAPVKLATTATASSPVGTYPITASGAADANYVITHVAGSLAVTSSTPVVKINFQPSGSTVPAGYLADVGAVFGNRGNGFAYGWNSTNTASTRDRNSTRSPDQRYDTLTHMQRTGGAQTWEIGLPNGTYRVWGVSGDATAFDSVYRINVEGLLTIAGTPTTSTRWMTGTNTVTVTDGRLTVSNGTGASNNKICFLEITPVQLTQFTGASVPALRLAQIRRDASGRFSLQVGNDASYVVEASSDLKTWTAVDVVASRNGELTFSDPEATGQPQRFYRVWSTP